MCLSRLDERGRRGSLDRRASWARLDPWDRWGHLDRSGIPEPEDLKDFEVGHDALGLDRAALEARLREMGAALGPPWSEDYKLATLAAWLHLERSGSDRRYAAAESGDGVD